MSKTFALALFMVVGIVLFSSCSSCESQKRTVEKPAEPYIQKSPAFDADSAYSFVEKQVSFGPRVPNTKEHKACGDFLVSKLQDFGAEVTEQKADILHYTGKKIPIRNIIGSFSPEKKNRVLLYAHWDSRSFADEETDSELRNKPISGADDGASGVGVLLEVARQLQMQPVDFGVDIIFFDLEDWGPPSYETNYPEGDWWCLGSQYWAANPHVENYHANFGILLDMVGASDATFLFEGHSVQYASPIVRKVWNKAKQMGFSNYFLEKRGGYIMDDHVPVNQYNRAPSINIINLKDNTRTGFVSYWHTQKDDMRNISKTTLHAVGQTVLEFLYSERVH